MGACVAGLSGLGEDDTIATAEAGKVATGGAVNGPAVSEGVCPPSGARAIRTPTSSAIRQAIVAMIQRAFILGIAKQPPCIKPGGRALLGHAQTKTSGLAGFAAGSPKAASIRADRKMARSSPQPIASTAMVLPRLSSEIAIERATSQALQLRE
jgi:hypothetical protein